MNQENKRIGRETFVSEIRFITLDKVPFLTHYENTPIQIYRKFHLQKTKKKKKKKKKKKN